VSTKRALSDDVARRSSLGKRLRVHAGSKLVADVAGRGLQFLLAYLAQRSLGPAAYGQFTYALAIGFVVATLTDLGLQLTLTREMSRDEAEAARIAGVGLSIKLALAVVGAAVLAGFSLTRPAPLQFPTFVVGLALICISFVETLGYVFRGLQRVEHEAGLLLLMRVAIFGLGVAALMGGGGVLGLGLAYLVGGGLAAGAGLLWLRRRFFSPRFAVAPPEWWGMLRQALPLGGAIVCSVVYTRTPVFLLDAMRGAEAVGLFGVAQKLIEPMALMPAALMAAVFPAFTQGLALNNGQAAWLGQRSVVLLALAGGAVAAAGFLGGPWLIEQLYGRQYAGSESPLQILALAVPLIFVNYALTHFIVAFDRQALNLLLSALLFAVNAALCLTLIPRYGPAGAAAAMLVSELLLLGLCSWALYAQTRRT
jgi:O-antigen/teichoic acid export membrane protein